MSSTRHIGKRVNGTFKNNIVKILIVVSFMFYADFDDKLSAASKKLHCWLWCIFFVECDILVLILVITRERVV